MAGVMVTLDDEHAEQLRALIREKGEKDAARIVGVASTQTLFRAAAGITISHLTHTLICDRLGVAPPSPAPARPVVEVPAVVPSTVAPPKTRERGGNRAEPAKPDGVARWRTVTRAGDELASFSLRVDAERAFRVDARAVAVVEVVTGEVVQERPRRKLA